MQDVLVSTARTNESIVPCDTTDAAIMTSKGPHNLILGRVPYLEISSVGSYSEIMSIS